MPLRPIRDREIKESGADAGALNRFWFTVLDDDLDPAQLLSAPIWLVAGGDTPRALLE